MIALLVVMAATDFTIDFTSAETSDDSNREHETFVVRSGELAYTWRYSGYHPDEAFVRERKAKAKVRDAAALERLVAPFLVAKEAKLPPGAEHERDVEFRLSAKGTRFTLKGKRPRGPNAHYDAVDALLDELRASLPESARP